MTPRGRAAARLLAFGGHLLLGFALAALLSCLVAGYQLGVAAGELHDLRRGQRPLLGEPEWPQSVWPTLALIGAAAAAVVCVFIHRRLKAAGSERLTLWAFGSLCGLALLSWLAWQTAGIAVFWEAARPSWTGKALIGSIGFGTLALALATAAVGNPVDGWRRASAVRVQLVVLGALIVAVFVVPLTAAQMNDVLRAWGDGPLSRVATGVAGALLMGAVVRASASALLAPRPHEGRWPASTRPAVVGTLAAAAMFGALQAWVGLVLLVVSVGFAWVTRWADPREPDDAARPGLLRLAGSLGLVPLGVICAGLVAALTDTLLLPSGLTNTDKWLLVATATVAVIFALHVALSRPQESRTAQAFEGEQSFGAIVGVVAFLLGAFSFLDVVSVLLVLGAGSIAFLALPDRGGLQFWAAGGAALGVATAVYVDPIAIPRELGALGLVLIALAGLLTALHLAATLGARRAFRVYLPHLPKNVPVVTVLALWAAFAWVVASDAIHQVRTESEGQPAGTLRAAVGAWLKRETAGGERRVPMVVVAASGGGAKAAYWTGLVVDCLFGGGPPTDDARECPPPRGPDRFGRLFLTSSVSGGSIGVYHAVRRRQPSTDWVDANAGREVLSPVVAWGLFHDLPAFMLGMRTDPRECGSERSCRREADRAVVQEAAIAGRNGIAPPKSERMLVEPSRRLPVTVFGTTLDGAQRRVLLSPVLLDTREPDDPACPRTTPQLGPEALDGHDLLAGSPLPDPSPDLPLVTAAHVSARFPVVEPAARLGETRSPSDGDGCAVGARSVVVRDGGYVENSGVLTVEDLLPDLRRAIEEVKQPTGKQSIDVPIIVVSIDDDPVAANEDPQLDLVPSALGIAQQAGPGVLTAGARNRIRKCVYENVDYTRISPGLHAGVEAATGWELSETARTEDLIASLRPGEPAWQGVQSVKSVIEGKRPVHCLDP